MIILIRIALILSFLFNTNKDISTDRSMVNINYSNQSNKLIYGTATWYGGKFHGRKTANGDIYNKYNITCATRDRTIPFGSKLKITNIETGKSITVVVNDRMAKTGKHTIDLSVGAFVKLAPKKQGVIKIKIEKL